MMSFKVCNDINILAQENKNHYQNMSNIITLCLILTQMQLSRLP